MCLSMRPRLAGVLIGLMVIKPQFGLLVPVALLAGGHYKTFASAAVTIAVMALFATIALGPAIWIDFLWAEAGHVPSASESFRCFRQM